MPSNQAPHCTIPQLCWAAELTPPRPCHEQESGKSWRDQASPARILRYASSPEQTPPQPMMGTRPCVSRYMSFKTSVDRSINGCPLNPPSCRAMLVIIDSGRHPANSTQLLMMKNESAELQVTLGRIMLCSTSRSQKPALAIVLGALPLQEGIGTARWLQFVCSQGSF